VKSVCLVLALLFALVLILPGCDGGDSLPYVGPVDGDGAPSDGGVVPTPPDNGTTPPPPPPPVDDSDSGLQPPAPPIFR
jgi:hypothetical protein